MSDWPAKVNWWQVYPFGFLDAEPTALPADADVHHRLRSLEPGWAT